MRLKHAAIVIASLAAAPFAASAAEVESLPVAAVTIYPGETVGEAMLAEREFPAGTAANYPVVATRAALAGKIARRTLLPGKLIARNAIGEPELVAKGSIIEASYEGGGLLITTSVLALQAGQLGALIQVRNVDTGKVVIGAVQPDGNVRVGGR